MHRIYSHGHDMTFLESKNCTSRFNCAAFCLVDADWRKEKGAPDICPFGVTLETASALREKSIAEHNKLSKPRPPCSSLGKLTGEQSACATCSGEHMESVHVCFVHAKCTITRQVKDNTVHCCAGCNEYEAAGNPIIIHRTPTK